MRVYLAAKCSSLLSLSCSVLRHSIPDPILYSLDTSDALSEALAQFVVKAQDEVLEKRDSFKVAVSGGSLPKLLGQHLTGREGMKWEKWSVAYTSIEP